MISMSDKIKWMAATGYIMVIADSFTTQLFDFHQFHLLGYYVNLVTLTPLIIYCVINKSHSEPFVVDHLRNSIRIYYWYIGWSVISGIIFEPNNLWLDMAGVNVTWLMVFVILYVTASCGSGIIWSFKKEE